MALSDEQRRKLVEKMNKNNSQIEKPMENQPVFKPDENNIWFIKDSEEIEGPFSDSDMLDFIDSGIIKKLTKIQKNDEGWQYAFKSELNMFFTKNDSEMVINKSEAKPNKSSGNGLTIIAWVIGIIVFIIVVILIGFKVLTKQLERNKESTDAANLRSAYAEIMTSSLSGDEVHPINVTKTQSDTEWISAPEIGGVTVPNPGLSGWIVTLEDDNQTVKIVPYTSNTMDAIY